MTAWRFASTIVSQCLFVLLLCGSSYRIILFLELQIKEFDDSPLVFLDLISTFSNSYYLLLWGFYYLSEDTTMQLLCTM